MVDCMNTWTQGLDAMDEDVWHSIQRKGLMLSSNQVAQIHAELFERLIKSFQEAFGAIQSALVQVQLQQLVKLQALQQKQQAILLSQHPSRKAITEFEENVRKIGRSVESFTAHAGNLSHVKLTLARAAAFVAPEGNLANLVITALGSSSELGSETWQDTTASFFTQPLTLHAGLPRTRPMIPSAAEFECLDGEFGFESSMPAQRPGKLVKRSLDKGQERGFRLDHSGPSSLNRIPNSTCFVFYLPGSATNESLRNLFERYGTVLNAYVAMDKVTNRTRGFGFVDFASAAEAQIAVMALDKFPLEGKYLSVSIKV